MVEAGLHRALFSEVHDVRGFCGTVMLSAPRLSSTVVKGAGLLGELVNQKNEAK